MWLWCPFTVPALMKSRPEMAKAYLDGRKFTRHQKKVVDAVFERLRLEEEQEKERGKEAEQEPEREPGQEREETQGEE